MIFSHRYIYSTSTPFIKTSGSPTQLTEGRIALRPAGVATSRIFFFGSYAPHNPVQRNCKLAIPSQYRRRFGEWEKNKSIQNSLDRMQTHQQRSDYSELAAASLNSPNSSEFCELSANTIWSSASTIPAPSRLSSAKPNRGKRGP